MKSPRSVLFAAVAALLLTLVPVTGASADPAAPEATPERTAIPNSISVLGDSISTATGTGILGAEVPANSWSTGTNATVNSTYRRLLATNSGISGNNHTMAENGRRMVHMAEQAAAMPTNTEYVQVQLGGNDLCRPSVAEMTSVEDYRAQFVAGLDAIAQRTPDALVLTTSIPDVYNLWYIRYAPTSLNGGQSNQAGAARLFVDLGVIPCLSLLANPASTAPADMERRDQVRQRNLEFNQVLAEECAKVLRCRFDDHAMFNFSSNRVNPPHGDYLPRAQWTFTDNDISRNAAGLAGILCPLSGFTGSNCGDHFHPSLAGQTKLAEIAWGAAFDFADTSAPAVTTDIAPAPNAAGWNDNDVVVSVDAHDEAGIRGLEHRVHHPDGTVDGWTPVLDDNVDVPVSAEGISTVEVRALDLNGNLSASELVTVQIDETDPTVTLTSPADGAVFTLGESVAADFACADALSGVESCVGTVDDGDDVDTATVGSKQFSVTATDLAGNSDTEIHTYEVHYALSGVSGPLASAADGTFRVNQAVPVRFVLADIDGALDATAVPQVLVARPGQDGTAATQPGAGQNGNVARWDAAAEQYLFNVDTRGLAAGEWEIVILPGDGSEHRFAITLR